MRWINKMIVAGNITMIVLALIALKNIDLIVNLFNLKDFYDTGIFKVTHDMEDYYLSSMAMLFAVVTWLLLSSLLILFVIKEGEK